MKSVRDIAREFMGRGGKKLRPRLCRIVREALLAEGAGEGRTGDFGQVLEAVECFHKASLIHDDIQDGDEERYGMPSVHAEHGIPLAIAVGDWLVAEGYRLLATSGFPRAADMLAAASESHLQLSEGQGDEQAIRFSELRCATEDETLSIYRRKTGEAFALAARLGAIAALGPGERSQCVERELVRFGLAFGVLFQMRDDAADGETALAPSHREAAWAECADAASAIDIPTLSSALAAFSEALARNGGLASQSGIASTADLL